MTWTTAHEGDICDDCGEELNEGEDVFEFDVGVYLCEGCYEDEADDDNWDDPIDGVGFADPGGNSALRAETKDNPRNLPCPTCKKENKLTPLDVKAGYQCDGCADGDEKGGY